MDPNPGFDYSRVWTVYEMLTPRPDDLINTNRFFVREGEVMLWDEKDRKKKKRYVFLFNDIMLITKREGSKKYWLRVYITLRSPYVKVEDTSTGYAPVLKLHCKTRSFTFFTHSSDSNREWAHDIDLSISGDREKKAANKTLLANEKPVFDSGTKIGSLGPVMDDHDHPVPILAPPPGHQPRPRSTSRGSNRASISSPNGSAVYNGGSSASSSTGSLNLLDDIVDFSPAKPAKQQQHTPQPSQFGGLMMPTSQPMQPMQPAQPANPFGMGFDQPQQQPMAPVAQQQQQAFNPFFQQPMQPQMQHQMQPQMQPQMQQNMYGQPAMGYQQTQQQANPFFMQPQQQQSSFQQQQANPFGMGGGGGYGAPTNGYHASVGSTSSSTSSSSNGPDLFASLWQDTKSSAKPATTAPAASNGSANMIDFNF